MKQIDGFFTYEPLLETENHYLENLHPPGGSLRFFMPGRCADYYALQDICLSDTKKVAYTPVYTCETALAPLLKAGYELLFYDVSRDLTSISDERILDRISVVSLCDYYDLCSYDREFIWKYSERGITIVEDMTHSVFSADGVDPHCDYVVGSMRKWTGVPAGGLAIKRKGDSFFPVLSSDETHLFMCSMSMRGKQQLLQAGIPNPQTVQKFNDTLWDAEMMLRRISGSYGSDRGSEYITRHYDLEQPKQRRRANYQYLLERMPEHPQIAVVFPAFKEGVVPSHFTVYAKDRDMVQSYLAGQGAETTTYWLQGPVVDTGGHGDADYTYSHALSFTCDQRYGTEDMEYIYRQIEGMLEEQELGHRGSI